MAAHGVCMELVHLLDCDRRLAAPPSEAGIPPHGHRRVAALRFAEPAAGGGGGGGGKVRLLRSGNIMQLSLG